MRWVGLLLSLSLLASGCSVGMAMSGSEEPNLGAVQSGSSRGAVEMQLGSPEKSTTLEDGYRLDMYKYEIGNEPSPKRAAFHGIMDVITYGGWELIGTPIEAFQGSEEEMTIKYNDEGKVVSINPGGYQHKLNTSQK